MRNLRIFPVVCKKSANLLYHSPTAVGLYLLACDMGDLQYIGGREAVRGRNAARKPTRQQKIRRTAGDEELAE